MIGLLVVCAFVALEIVLSSLAARWLRELDAVAFCLRAASPASPLRPFLRRRVASLERRLDHAEAALCALRLLCGGVFVWGLLCLGGAS